MSVLLVSGEERFEIPNDVLEKCKISKEEFAKKYGDLDVEVAGQHDDCTLVYFGTTCCSTKPICLRYGKEE